MLDLLKFILCNFGVAYFITHTVPLKKVREFVTSKSVFIGTYLSCTWCVGGLTSIGSYFGVYRSLPCIITMAVFIFIGSITAKIGSSYFKCN